MNRTKAASRLRVDADTYVRIRAGQCYVDCPVASARKVLIGRRLSIGKSARSAVTVTVTDIYELRDGYWRVTFVNGDATEKRRFLAWGGGYVSDPALAMLDAGEVMDDDYPSKFVHGAHAS